MEVYISKRSQHADWGCPLCRICQRPALPRDGAPTRVLFHAASPGLEVHRHVCLLY